MNRTVVAVVLVLAVLGGGAAWWFSQGTEAPTADATAPPLQTTTTLAADAPTETEPVGEVSDPATVYALTGASRASFTIDEELRGTPSTVVAVSTIVLGEILFDSEDPASVEIGTILVNARDFTTDSANRNRAIRGPILDVDNFEFIEFVPTSVDGLAVSDEPSAFTLSGDLTIREVTNPVTFEVTAKLNEDRTISGMAVAEVDRTDWGLNIPSAPGVANVSEMVTLTLDFVAAPIA
ncbi:MAG TPA: YceI family protein [Acidimicrobiia bacterium]|nr:YceI family protein [Acidimicrobiia bacterium]